MQRRCRIKICGITRLEDAMAALQAGADALGFVFYPDSPRYVAPQQAAAICRALGPFVCRVGLFVNAGRPRVQDCLDQVPLDLLQFHGDETEADCLGFNKPYIKALRVRDNLDLQQAVAAYPEAQGLLLDSYQPGLPGGTGQTFDWSRCAEVQAKPVVLAGGLTAENVAAAIRQVQPYAVDVSGGVESTKGIKDPDKLIHFTKAVYETARP